MSSSDKISISFVLPSYNEERNLVYAVESISRFCKENNVDNEILVVDDGSSDNSLAILRSLKKSNPTLKILIHSKNFGYGAALKSGFKYSTKDWVFFTDSDNQFDIDDLKAFFEYTNYADFICGKRKKRKDSLLRKINALLFNQAVRTFFKIPVSDVDCAFKLMKRNILQSIHIQTNGAMINTELLHKAKQKGAKIVEIDVKHYPRTKGSATGSNPIVILKAIKDFSSYKFKTTKFSDLFPFFVCLTALIAGLTALNWSYSQEVILAYGDAEAHLNLAKKATSSLTPGLSQIGGVWLPLPHLLMIPFVYNDWLWTTGIGGSLVSLTAFVWASFILYKLAYLITKNPYASLVAPAVWIFNPNALYLATTPMTEVILFACTTSSIYFLLRWVKNRKDIIALVFCAFFAFCASLTRYDGWFLIVIELFIIGVVSLKKTKSFTKTEGVLLTYGSLALFGIFIWIAWNYLIFGNPFYFANSEYGSKAQQMWFHARGYLPTYKNLELSALYYLTNSWIVLGSVVSGLSIVGLLYFIGKTVKEKLAFEYLAVFVLLFSFLFYTVSLYTGQASLILPTYAQDWYMWSMSNTRYGIQMLLPAAIFTAILASKIKVFKFVLIILIVAQGIYMVNTRSVIAFNDGTQGLSSQLVSKGPDAQPVEVWVNENYDSGLVLMDDYRRPISPVQSGISMENFISVGNKPYWEESLANPTKHAKWIIIQKADTDAVWTGLKNQKIIDDHYVNVFRKGNIWVYKIREDNLNFVQKRGQELTLSNKKFTMIGVNIYDIVSRSKEEIDTHLLEISQTDMNTIRLWGFNKEGRLNDNDFEKMDYIIDESSKKNIRLIIVLGNQYEDYGGRSNFTHESNLDSFYTDPKAKKLYKEHVLELLNRKNTVSGRMYKDEPTILAWELLNEPRYENDKESRIVAEWMEEIAQYVLQHDNKHLISSGTEGFISQEYDKPYYENHGADYLRTCGLDVIDICSAHLYPKYFNENLEEYKLEEIINEWQKKASSFNKVFYMGEIGYDLSAPGSKSSNIRKRKEFTETLAKIVYRKNISGALLWNLSREGDEHFSLSYNDKDGRVILGIWNNLALQSSKR